MVNLLNSMVSEDNQAKNDNMGNNHPKKKKKDSTLEDRICVALTTVTGCYIWCTCVQNDKKKVKDGHISEVFIAYTVSQDTL